MTEEDVLAYKMGLSGTHPDDLDKAFLAAMRECQQKPRVSDILGRLVVTAGRVIQSFYVMAGDGHCYAGSKSVGLHEDAMIYCGCQKCKPEFYCREPGCAQPGFLDTATNMRMPHCREHARGLPARTEQHSPFRSELQKVAEKMAMPGGTHEKDC